MLFSIFKKNKHEGFWFKLFCKEASNFRSLKGRIGTVNEINEMILTKYKKPLESTVEILEQIGKITIEEIINNKDFRYFKDLNQKLGDHKLKICESGLDFKLSKIINIMIENNNQIGKQIIPDPYAKSGFYHNYILKITPKDKTKNPFYDSGSTSNLEKRFVDKQKKYQDKSYVEKILKYSTEYIYSAYSYTYLEPNNRLPVLINEFYDKEMIDLSYYQIEQIEKFIIRKKEFHGNWGNSDALMDLSQKFLEDKAGQEVVKQPKTTSAIPALGNLAFVTYLSSHVIISSYQNELNLFSEYFQNLINVF